MNKIFLATFFICFSTLAFLSCEKTLDTPSKSESESDKHTSGGGSFQAYENEGGTMNFCSPAEIVETQLPDGRIIVYEIPTLCSTENPFDNDDVLDDKFDISNDIQKESIK